MTGATISLYAERAEILNVYIAALRHSTNIRKVFLKVEPMDKKVLFVGRKEEDWSRPRLNEWKELGLESTKIVKLLNSTRRFVGMEPIEMPWVHPRNDADITRQLLAGTFRAKPAFLGVFKRKANIPKTVQNDNPDATFVPVRIDTNKGRAYTWNARKQREEVVPTTYGHWADIIEEVEEQYQALVSADEFVEVATGSPYYE